MTPELRPSKKLTYRRKASQYHNELERLRALHSTAQADGVARAKEIFTLLVFLNGTCFAAAAAVMAGTASETVRTAASFAGSWCGFGLGLAALFLFAQWFWALSEAQKIEDCIEKLSDWRLPVSNLPATQPLRKNLLAFAIGAAALLATFITATVQAFNVTRHIPPQSSASASSPAITYQFRLPAAPLGAVDERNEISPIFVGL